MNTAYREDTISWDECFMSIAHIIAKRSKDPSTQVGSVIATPENVVVGVGYNGFPRGIDSNTFPWDKEGAYQDTKYAYICHAEENAIYNSNSSTKGCKIYATLFPCNECAKAIIQNGITELIYESDKYHDDAIYIASRRMFDAAHIIYREYKSEFSK